MHQIYCKSIRFIDKEINPVKGVNFVDPEGIEPSTLPCHGNVLPLDYGPFYIFIIFL